MKSHTKKTTAKKSKDNNHSCSQTRKKPKGFNKFFNKHKNIILPTSISLIGLFVIIIFCITWSISNGFTSFTQSYFINIAEEGNLVVDCNLTKSNDSLVCNKKEVFGTFSNYDSVELTGAEANGNAFKLEFSYVVPKDSYEVPDFNLDNFQDEIEVSSLIGLHDKILDKILLSKEVRVLYKFNEKDKNLISEAHSKWQEEKEKQAETESQNQAKTKPNSQINTNSTNEQSENKQNPIEEITPKKAEEGTEFPAELANDAFDSCYSKLYKETSMLLPKYVNIYNYWSGEKYNQTIIIEDPSRALKIVCNYNWGIKMATSINLDRM